MDDEKQYNFTQEKREIWSKAVKEMLRKRKKKKSYINQTKGFLERKK